METKINVAEILKNKPKGTKLYADAFGELSIEDIYAEDKDELGITLSSKDGDELLFYNNGKYNMYGEPILVPSKSMHDWSKFAWKKGDVLVSEGRKILHVIFEGFNDDTYTTFKGKHYICNYDDNEDYNEEEYNDYNKEVNERTIEFKKDNDDGAQTYIKTIEERLGGKLNRGTLEIEKTQPEFKDGDIVFVESHMLGINTSSMITAIFRKEKENDKYKFSPALCESNVHGTYLRESPVVLSPSDIKTFSLATDSEKQQLFDALAKYEKAWNAEKKEVADLKPKVELKPFEKVLCRDGVGKEWHIDLFESVLTDNSEYNYKCMVNVWKICIPYEGNEYLLGTTNDPK